MVQNFINTVVLVEAYIGIKGDRYLNHFDTLKCRAVMHLCIYVYILHTYIMKENGKAAIQRDLARLGEWANKSLMKFSEDKCKVLHLGRKKLWQQYRLGLPGRDASFQEAAWPSSNPRPGSWSWGWPRAGCALTHGAQSCRASNKVHWQPLTQQVMNQGQGTVSGSSQEQKETGAETGLAASTAGIWLQGLTAPNWAEMGSWAGRGGGDPRGDWAGKLRSWCTQGSETAVLTGPGDAGRNKVDIGQLCALAAKTDSILGCMRRSTACRKGLSCSAQYLLDHI